VSVVRLAAERQFRIVAQKALLALALLAVALAPSTAARAAAGAIYVIPSTIDGTG